LNDILFKRFRILPFNIYNIVYIFGEGLNTFLQNNISMASKKEPNKIEIVEFKSLRQNNTQLQLPNAKELSELKDTVFIITGFDIYTLPKYELAIVKIRFSPNQQEDILYRTTSSVIVKQLKEIIKPILESGKYVKASLVKPRGKRYYTLA
jgi:hypothetical protein